MNTSEIVRHEPDNAYTFLWRGMVHKDKGEFKKAIAEFSKGIKLSPKFIDLYLHRARSYHLKGEHDKSIADYTELVRIGDCPPYLDRGDAYRKKGDYENAIADYSKAIKSCSTYCKWYAMAYLPRDKIYLEKGEYDKAIADFSEAIKHEQKMSRCISCVARRITIKAITKGQ